jgi:four helix bundle protein
MNQGKSMRIASAKQLTVYQDAFTLAILVYETSKQFPVEERYALVSQIRRSSRSVCLTLREAWAKRRYRAHFVSKLTDCDGENSETDSSLDFALSCGFITQQQHDDLTNRCTSIGRMLGAMILNPNPFLIKKDRPDP